jgi:hypothetical protein
MDFKVVRVGCNNSGFTDDQVAPLFDDAPENCLLPGVWLHRRDPNIVRLVIAGSRDACMLPPNPGYKRSYILDPDKYAWAKGMIEATISRMPNPEAIEVICGLATGGDQVGGVWGRERRLVVHGFEAEWDKYGAKAGFMRNTDMGWYGTHLIALTLGETPGTKQMIELAQSGGLRTRIYDCRQIPQTNVRPDTLSPAP